MLQKRRRSRPPYNFPSPDPDPQASVLEHRLRAARPTAPGGPRPCGPRLAQDSRNPGRAPARLRCRTDGSQKGKDPGFPRAGAERTGGWCPRGRGSQSNRRAAKLCGKLQGQNQPEGRGGVPGRRCPGGGAREEVPGRRRPGGGALEEAPGPLARPAARHLLEHPGSSGLQFPVSKIWNKWSILIDLII